LISETKTLGSVVLISALIVVLGTCVCFLYAPDLKSAVSTPDQKLTAVKRIFGLRALEVREYAQDPLFLLGQALFFDPIISGNRTTSCASCHLLSKGLTDGRPVRGVYEILKTRSNDTGKTYNSYRLRNALDLWNRDANPVRALFWDGRVEALDPTRNTFRSPLGSQLPFGFKNILEIQSLFPIATDDEMIGHAGDRSPDSLPPPHSHRVNELAPPVQGSVSADQILAIHKKLMVRLLGSETPREPWQEKYRKLFLTAFPDRAINDMGMVQFGASIAHFEELAFSANGARWDRYLAGQADALTDAEKRGALLFYGRGGCVTCHSGPLLSDFQFQGIGIFSLQVEINNELLEDLGRFAVTGNDADLYKFRTPPLRNVTKTVPYFHDGSSTTLEDALRRHVDPISYNRIYRRNGSALMDKAHVGSIAPIVLSTSPPSGNELAEIAAFLRTLDSQSRKTEEIIPTSVPSGLPINGVR
jgi:cytochrome c peroxidase